MISTVTWFTVLVSSGVAVAPPTRLPTKTMWRLYKDDQPGYIRTMVIYDSSGVIKHPGFKTAAEALRFVIEVKACETKTFIKNPRNIIDCAAAPKKP